MRSIAVIARKGGAGKTTLAVNLAIAAHLRGLATVLADADPQRSASAVLKVRATPGPRRIETSSAKLFALQQAARRDGVDVMVIDTPCGPEEELAQAITLADLTLVVVRPTYLDIAAAVPTIEIARRLGRASQIVLNQAYFSRTGKENPSVQKAMNALRFTNMPLCPVIVRSRTLLQTSLANGQSAEELGASAAADEIGALWDHLNRPAAAEVRLKRA